MSIWIFFHGRLALLEAIRLFCVHLDLLLTLWLFCGHSALFLALGLFFTRFEEMKKRAQVFISTDWSCGHLLSISTNYLLLALCSKQYSKITRRP